MSSQTASEKTAPRTPRLARGRTRVAALLAAGAAVIAERGYEPATMTEIAARAGASIGSLYQFFPTKELLATQLHAGHLEALTTMLDALHQDCAGASPGDIAERLFARLAAFLAEHPAFTALAERRAIDKARKTETRTRMRGQIAALLTGAAPPLTPAQADIMAVLILQFMKTAVALAETDDAATRDAAVATLRQMLRSHLDNLAAS